MGIYEPCPSEFTEEERRILESCACCVPHTFCGCQDGPFGEYDNGKTLFAAPPDPIMDYHIAVKHYATYLKSLKLSYCEYERRIKEYSQRIFMEKPWY